MKAAIANGKVSKYVVDFPTEDTVDVEGIITIPHLGASTAESEDNCAIMAAHQLDDFLKTGNIKNSVNYPNVALAHVPGCKRVAVFHKNIPAIITKISGAFAEQGINIENFVNGSKGDNAYTLVETATPVSDEIAAKIAEVESVVRVLVI